MESNQTEDNFFFENYGKKIAKTNRRVYWAVFIFLFSAAYLAFISAPAGFVGEKVVAIEKGATITSAGLKLSDSGIIRSPAAFRVLLKFFDGDHGVKAGDYFFDKKQNAIMVAYRLANGERGFEPISVVIPEGTSILEMTEIFSAKISGFDSKSFLKLAKNKEGYLFPDTYSFTHDISAEAIVTAMEDNFSQKISELKNPINGFGKSLKDVITMASILEEEGRTLETRRTIAGILWKRLEIGMPLQVDAAFQYVNGKNTFELSLDDLKIDSPYNTYLYKGLPPTPITNPGEDSIIAAVTPIQSPYLYYLTDKEGVMHYAKTHDEHVANKAKYLK